jgi:hypothetical protein
MVAPQRETVKAGILKSLSSEKARPGIRDGLANHLACARLEHGDGNRASCLNQRGDFGEPELEELHVRGIAPEKLR